MVVSREAKNLLFDNFFVRSYSKDSDRYRFHRWRIDHVDTIIRKCSNQILRASFGMFFDEV